MANDENVNINYSGGMCSGVQCTHVVCLLVKRKTLYVILIIFYKILYDLSETSNNLIFTLVCFKRFFSKCLCRSCVCLSFRLYPPKKKCYKKHSEPTIKYALYSLETCVVSFTVTTSAFGRNNNCYNNYGLLSTFRLNLNAGLRQRTETEMKTGNKSRST